MNTSAASYTPTLRAQKYLASRQTQSAPNTVQPSPIAPHQTPPPLSPNPSAPSASSAALPMTTAEHLRQMYLKKQKDAGKLVPPTPTSSPAVSADPPLGMLPPPPPAATVASAGTSERRRYTRDQLLSMREASLERVRHGRIVDVPPFLKVPAALEVLLANTHALEYVDVDRASGLMQGRHYVSPLTFENPAAAMDYSDVRCYYCGICSQGGPHPCNALHEVILNAEKYALSCPRGPFLMQSKEVVWGMIQLSLVFEARQSSLRLRLLAEKAPGIKRLITEYLCGEGYHLSPPPVTAHDEWEAMNAMLHFDAIRDSRTRIKTDVSKRWRKYKTQFEQFVTFFSYRDHVPTNPVKNTITPSIKPGMVAMLTGDVVAVVLLHHLGFFIPPDYYWSIFPFLHEALGEGTLSYDIMRHLGIYYSTKQDVGMYNPIDTTFLRLK